ncbi:MAG TPA: TolC family protein [Candidatus Brocadiaceae bacterium]
MDSRINNVLLLVISLCIILFVRGVSLGGENKSKSPIPDAPSPANIEMNTSLKSMGLSVKESIIYALRNNFDIEITRLDTKKTDADITTAKSVFDPVFKLTGNMQNNETPSANILQTGTTTTGPTIITPIVAQGKTADALIQSLTPTGAIVSLEYNLFRNFLDPSAFQLLNPYYQNYFQAAITQPLLKGAGWFYTMSPIYIARNNKKISLAQFKTTAIEVANAVQGAYWSYVQAIDFLRVSKKSLDRAEDLLRKNKIQVETGTLAPIEIVDAEAGVASRVETVINAENAIRDREDELKKVMHLADNNIISDATIMPSDKPVFEPKTIELKDTLKIAMERRPELHGLHLQVENAGMQTRRKKNELYPQLDFTGGVRYSGLGGKDTKMGGFQGDNYIPPDDFQGEFFGLVLSIPIGNRSARSQYNKAKTTEQQANMSVGKMELDIVVEVRESVRQVMTNIERVKATKKARELAEKRLEVEEKKYSVGRSTNLEILRQQEGLAIAEGEETKAIIDYEISLGNLEKAKGTILEAYDIKLDEEKG